MIEVNIKYTKILDTVFIFLVASTVAYKPFLLNGIFDMAFYIFTFILIFAAYKFRKQINIFPIQIILPMVLFFINCYVSIIYSIDKSIAFNYSNWMLVEFVFSLICTYYIISFRDLRKFPELLAYSMALAVILILLSYPIDNNYRLASGNVGTNGTAYHLVLGYIASLFALKKRKIENESIINMRIASIIIFLGTFFTASRQGIIGIVLAQLLYLFLSEKNSSNRILRIVTYSGMIYLVYLVIMRNAMLYDIIGIRIESLINTINGTSEFGYSDRDVLIKVGFDLFSKNPIIGIGFYNFAVNWYDLENTLSYAHNNYVELLVDLGIIGTAIFYFPKLVLLFQSLRLNAKQYADLFVDYIITSIIIIMILDITTVSFRFSIQYIITSLGIYYLANRNTKKSNMHSFVEVLK